MGHFMKKKKEKERKGKLLNWKCLKIAVVTNKITKSKIFESDNSLKRKHFHDFEIGPTKAKLAHLDVIVNMHRNERF